MCLSIDTYKKIFHSILSICLQDFDQGMMRVEVISYVILPFCTRVYDIHFGYSDLIQNVAIVALRCCSVIEFERTFIFCDPQLATRLVSITTALTIALTFVTFSGCLY
jgi:hypothetical protein